METRVAVISIIVEDGNSIEALNQRLHAAAPISSGGWGFPIGSGGINIISVAIDAPQPVISAPCPARSEVCPGIRENRLFLGDRSGGKLCEKAGGLWKGRHWKVHHRLQCGGGIGGERL